MQATDKKLVAVVPQLFMKNALTIANITVDIYICCLIFPKQEFNKTIKIKFLYILIFFDLTL